MVIDGQLKNIHRKITVNGFYLSLKNKKGKVVTEIRELHPTYIQITVV